MKLSPSVRFLISKMVELGHGVPHQINLLGRGKDVEVAYDPPNELRHYSKRTLEWEFWFEITGYSSKERRPYKKALVVVTWERLEYEEGSSKITGFHLYWVGVYKIESDPLGCSEYYFVGTHVLDEYMDNGAKIGGHKELLKELASDPEE